MAKIIIIIALVLSSCAHRSKNFMSQGNTFIKGGSNKDSTWSDSLEFKRASWYKELTLVADVWISDISPQSPFYSWISENGKKKLEQCQQRLLTFSYVLDSSMYPLTSLVSQIEAAGGRKIALSSFKDRLKLHSDYERKSLRLYEFNAFCFNSSTREIIVKLPNFKSLKLNL